MLHFHHCTLCDYKKYFQQQHGTYTYTVHINKCRLLNMDRSYLAYFRDGVFEFHNFIYFFFFLKKKENLSVFDFFCRCSFFPFV